MVNRICISINNKCNLKCRYCHFNEKNCIEEKNMNIYQVLDNVIEYAKGKPFKIGFVGNGEPLLNLNELMDYISYLKEYPNIQCYTITNGTIDLSDEQILFFKNNNVNVGFSLDGCKDLHDKYRCNSYDKVVSNIEKYKLITGQYPTINATVGRDTIDKGNEIIEYFKRYNTKITFSRMIGKYGISLQEYKDFISLAEKELYVRRGDMDCTMYGGKCAAGINNYFYANGNVYYCGNCIDKKPIASSSIKIKELEDSSISFDRTKCYKESICE